MDERLNISRKEDVHIFSVATNSKYYAENKKILKDIFDKSLKAKHGQYSLFDIQFELLGHILASYSAYNKYLRWKGLFARAIRNLKLNNAPLERITLAQSRLESMQNYAIAAQFFLGQLRSIGDGIAWWFLNYDRAALRLLAEHSYVSIPELGPGLYAEIQKCTELASTKKPFILNTITNILRFGDITIYDKSYDTYRLVEVKAGKFQNSRKLRRQAENLSLVQEALDTGSHNLAHPTITHTKLIAEKPMLTYIKILERSMCEAKDNLASSRIFGEYLSFCVFHLKEIVNLPKSQSVQITQNTIERCATISKTDEDLILPTFSNIQHIVHFSRMLAPYTIFPIDKDIRFSLISGDYLLLIFINVSGLARWLKKRGWKVEELSLPDKPLDLSKSQYIFLPILRVSKPNNPLVVELSLDIICGAAMELLMPESIERTVEAMLRHGFSQNICTVNFPNTGKYAWD